MLLRPESPNNLTFDKSCKITSEYIKSDKNVLHELINDKSYIKEIIYECNDNNFLTVVSQPGNIYKTVIYKSVAAEKKNSFTPNEDNILYSENCVRKQRAYIRGYMNVNMANFLCDELRTYKYLYVRTEGNELPFKDKIKFGSVNFHNDEPISYEPEYHTCEADLENIPDASWSFNFTLPLRRPFMGLADDTKNKIVEFDLLDLRWDNNEMWELLSKAINKYLKIEKNN